jgi:TRAP-type C4-dicarboxylate transport system permease small subunit
VNSTLTLYLFLALVIAALAAARAALEKSGRLTGVFRQLGRLEVLVLTLLLGLLVSLGFFQIVLRNFFHSGILWADQLMRHTVLWLGCLGAALATTRLRHINIDVFTRLLPDFAKPARRFVVYTATAAASFVLGVAALRLVIDEREYGEAAFLNLDTWMLQTVLPFAFFLIAYRCLVNLFLSREARPMDGTMEPLDR